MATNSVHESGLGSLTDSEIPGRGGKVTVAVDRGRVLDFIESGTWDWSALSKIGRH